MNNSRHESKPPLAGCSPESADTTLASQLESIYGWYGEGIYTLCLRLIANKKAAESATVEVFVKFGKEIASHPDESHARLRLCELAINASVAQLNRRAEMIARRLSGGLRLKLGRLRR